MGGKPRQRAASRRRHVSPEWQARLRAELSIRGVQRELARSIGATEGAISRLARNENIGASELVQPVSEFFGWRLPDEPLPPRAQAIADVAAELFEGDLQSFLKLERLAQELRRDAG